MHGIQQRRLLQSFSARVLCDRSSPEWIELFTRSAAGHVRFELATAAIVCVDHGGAGEGGRDALEADLSRIASLHGGACDLLHAHRGLLLLPDVDSAFTAARQVQALPCGGRLQIGLAVGPCETAWVEIRGGARRLLLGEAVEQAQALALDAPGGTIRLSPDLNVALQPRIEALADCLVTTEIDDQDVATVSLALPPRRADLLSSFAGLGLLRTQDPH